MYDAAAQYFGLSVPEPAKVFINDARAWVYQKSVEVADSTNKGHDLFDYVVHDCFSGGSVPGHMFTKLFWEDLSKVIKPEGVVAVVGFTFCS